MQPLGAKTPVPPLAYTLRWLFFSYAFRYTDNEKALRETQTLHAGCSKAEPKIFAPPHRPPSRGAGRPKSNQLEMVTTFTYKPSLVRIDARNFELSWSQTHTHTQTNKPTDRTDYNTLRR